MPEPMDDIELRKYVEAFADGELDVESNLRVLERMAMSPDATRRVVHQQELRRMVDRAMREQTPAVPAALRAKIEALTRPAAHAERAAMRHGASPIAGRIGRWAWPAAAAMIALAAVGLWLANRPPSETRPRIAAPDKNNHPFAAPVFAANLIADDRPARMGRKHDRCAEQIQNLRGIEQFTREVEAIPRDVENFLGIGGSMPVLDLSSVGYEFAGAGPCGLPGGKAVHLVYNPIDPAEQNASVSLWIRADAGEVQVEEGKVYAANPNDAAHPILVWRRGNVVYYLAGQATSRMLDAAKALYPVK